MKVIYALTFTVAIVFAEPPISKSYLPPPPGKGFQGNTAFQGLPQVIAARTLEHNHSNGLARSGDHDQVARFNNQHGYDNTIAVAKNGPEDEPLNYNFGYMVNDVTQGTEFGHREERQEEIAEGQYHVVLPDGRKQTVNYKADERGFKPQISYEETETGGYDANANTRNHGTGFHGDHITSGHDSHHGNGGHDFGHHGNQNIHGAHENLRNAY